MQFPFPELIESEIFFRQIELNFLFGDDNIGELAITSSNWLTSANWRLHRRTGAMANARYIGEDRGLPWSKIFDKYHFVIFLIYIAVI